MTKPIPKGNLEAYTPQPHDHPEHPDESLRPKAYRRLKITFLIALTIFGIEIAGSWFSGSLALLADAVHILSDILALTITLVAAWLASRLDSRTEKRSYGYYRLEVLAALVNGILLVFMAVFIVKEAFDRLMEPREIKGQIMFGVALFGLAANLFMLAVLKPVRKQNINVRGAFLHILADTLASVAVILAAIIIYFTNYTIADSIAGIAVAVLICSMAIGLIWDSVQILLEGTPRGMDPQEIQKTLVERFPQIKDIHDFHVWEIASHLFAMTAHIRAEVNSLEETRALIDAINEVIREKYGIGHTTFQVEPKSPRE